MHVRDIPLPRAVAARPRDARGIPVPAVTGWDHGVPQFRSTSWERQILCAVEQRCSICGDPLDDDVWTVVDGQAAAVIGHALDRGAEPVAPFLTYEAPGHQVCTAYAAVACPYLASPGARHSGVTATGQHRIEPGTRRGARSALAGFRRCVFHVTEDAPHLEIELATPSAIHHYGAGEELLELLGRLVDAEPADPGYRPFQGFGRDDRAVTRRFNRLRVSVARPGG